MALTTQVAKPSTRSQVTRSQPRWSQVRWVLGQVLVVAIGILVYFRIRGLAHASVDVAMGHAQNVSTLERWLGIDVEHAVQAPVAASQTLATAANWIYVWGHWPVILATMVWLLWRHRDVFRRLRDAMLVSGFLGMAVFVLIPRGTASARRPRPRRHGHRELGGVPRTSSRPPSSTSTPRCRACTPAGTCLWGWRSSPPRRRSPSGQPAS